MLKMTVRTYTYPHTYVVMTDKEKINKTLAEWDAACKYNKDKPVGIHGTSRSLFFRGRDIKNIEVEKWT